MNEQELETRQLAKLAFETFASHRRTQNSGKYLHNETFAEYGLWKNLHSDYQESWIEAVKAVLETKTTETETENKLRAIEAVCRRESGGDLYVEDAMVEIQSLIGR